MPARQLQICEGDSHRASYRDIVGQLRQYRGEDSDMG